MARNAGNNESPVYTYTVNISQAAAVATGVYNSTANPFGQDLLILGVTVRVTTPSTGASTVDIGVAAAAATVNDGLIDGLSLATGGLYTNAEDAGTNGEQTMVWGSSQFLNVAEASGDVAGVVGQLIVQYTYL
jgi:hypothetical protein